MRLASARPVDLGPIRSLSCLSLMGLIALILAPAALAQLSARTNASAITALAIHPNGGVIAIARFGSVILFPAAGGSQPTGKLKGCANSIDALRYSPDGKAAGHRWREAGPLRRGGYMEHAFRRAGCSPRRPRGRCSIYRLEPCKASDRRCKLRSQC